MTSSNLFVKDPSAVLDYAWDWATWLGSDTIEGFTVTVEAGLVLDSTTGSTTAVTAWLSGGTAGAEYDVTCRVVTAGGRTDERTIKVRVEER
jgi:hypothetical protein